MFFHVLHHARDIVFIGFFHPLFSCFSDNFLDFPFRLFRFTSGSYLLKFGHYHVNSWCLAFIFCWTLICIMPILPTYVAILQCRTIRFSLDILWGRINLGILTASFTVVVLELSWSFWLIKTLIVLKINIQAQIDMSYSCLCLQRCKVNIYRMTIGNNI